MMHCTHATLTAHDWPLAVRELQLPGSQTAFIHAMPIHGIFSIDYSMLACGSCFVILITGRFAWLEPIAPNTMDRALARHLSAE